MRNADFLAHRSRLSRPSALSLAMCAGLSSLFAHGRCASAGAAEKVDFAVWLDGGAHASQDAARLGAAIAAFSRFYPVMYRVAPDGTVLETRSPALGGLLDHARERG